MIDRLQFISNQTNSLSHLESIQRALDAGCGWVQLRIKEQSPENVLKIALEAKKLTEEYQAKLVINDYPAVARQVSAYGLHLGLNDMSIKAARKLVGSEMIIGGTANTLDDVIKRIQEGADYVGLGPFRFTNTKQNLSPILGLSGYATLINALKEKGYAIPLIAIGGIRPDDIDAILKTGIHGIAMSGAITDAPNPKNMIIKLKQIIC